MSNTPPSGNSLRPHGVLSNELSSVKSFTYTQCGHPCGLTSLALGDPQSASNRFGVEGHNTGLNSAPLPFTHNGPAVAFPAPPLWQEWEDLLQLVGQVPLNPISSHQKPKPYTQFECSQITQAPCAPKLVDGSHTWAGAFDPSPHLNLPVRCVCLPFFGHDHLRQS